MCRKCSGGDWYMVPVLFDSDDNRLGRLIAFVAGHDDKWL